MVTISEFEDTSKRVVAHLHTLLSICKDEEKEYGKPLNNTIRRFNALLFAVDDACKILNRGLDGKFSWEKEC